MKLVSFYFLLICVLNAAFNNLSAQPNQSGSDMIRIMHKRYQNKPCRSYTFSQKNSHYRNDSIIRHSEWHEAVEFPDKFRINFGKKEEGNFVIYKNDSAFNYKDGKLIKSRVDSSTLLLLIGGMYYRGIDDVLKRLEKANYRLIVLSEQKWENKNVLVIGANEKDLVANQIWVDKKTLTVVRIIEKINSKDWMDMRFESHQPWCSGFVETKVSFRRNGKLEQVEEYYDIKPSEGFSDK